MILYQKKIQIVPAHYPHYKAKPYKSQGILCILSSENKWKKLARMKKSDILFLPYHLPLQPMQTVFVQKEAYIWSSGSQVKTNLIFELQVKSRTEKTITVLEPEWSKYYWKTRFLASDWWKEIFENYEDCLKDLILKNQKSIQRMQWYVTLLTEYNENLSKK